MDENLFGEVKESLGSLTRWDTEKMSSGVVQKGVVGQLGVWVKTIRRFGLELRRQNKQGLADALDDRLQAFLLDITHYDRETLIPDSKDYSRLLCDMKLNREGVLSIDTERKESPYKTCLLIDCITNSQKALIEVLQLCLKETEDEDDTLTEQQSIKKPPLMTEPPKEYRIAYQLTRIVGMTQAKSAEKMNQQGLKTSKGSEIRQDTVSRMAAKWAEWQAHQDLPVEQNAPFAGKTITNHDVIVQGKRTDGRKPKKRGF